jgi:2-phosphosulfolactate phosphatase
VLVSTVDLDAMREPVDTPAAVVIDVMRAFTVAPWCFARGATAVYLAPDVEAAVAAREFWPDALLLKDGATDAPFDLPNAPGHLRRADLRDRAVVQVTTNGTRGAHAVADVDLVLCASFVTAAATVRALAASEVPAVTLVVTKGDEDRALADYLAVLLTGGAPDPGGYLRRAEASSAAAELRRLGADPAHPEVHRDDAALCLDLDAFDFALRTHPQRGYLALMRC